MKAVVLVGGEGTRLRPLTWDTPKQMLPIAGQPMLERVLAQLRTHGIDEVVLSLGYRPDAFVRAYPEGVACGVEMSYAVEPTPLDTAGAVRFAARAAGVEETFLVVNGDVLSDADLSALVAFHRSSGAEGTISLHRVENPSAFGVVPTDSEGRVQAFIEKPAPGTEPTDLVNAGAYVLEPSVLERIASGGRVSIERETFPQMVAEQTLFALADGSYWLDAGTPATYLAAHRDLIEGRRGSPPATAAREVGRSVWVVGSPRLEGTVRGASLVLEGTVVHDGAVVAASSLGIGCVIEPGAVVEGSVLLDGVVVGARARVVGSIVGKGARVGAGCDVRPLSVIGPGVDVAPGEVVDGARVPA